MEHDIYALPEAEITDREDWIFTAAEWLLEGLQACGAELSRPALQRHLEHLGATPAQIPALMDLAERKRITAALPEKKDSPAGDLHIPAVGKLILRRLQEYEIRLPDTALAVMELRYGIRDGIPRSAEETARLLGISEDTARTFEQRSCQRLFWAERRRRRRMRRRHLGDFLS